MRIGAVAEESPSIVVFQYLQSKRAGMLEAVQRGGVVGISEDVERNARKEKRKMLPREGDVRTHCVKHCGETKCSGMKGGERTKRQEPIASGGWTGR